MKFSPELVAFFQMVQEAIESEIVSARSMMYQVTAAELQKARISSKIVEAEVFFENRGSANGRTIGWVDYRGFSLNGRLFDGTLFEAYGQVGRKQGREKWCSIGVTFKFFSPDSQTDEAWERDCYTNLGYCNEEAPFNMCSMADKRTDFVQWYIENAIQHQAEEALHRRLGIRR